MRLAGSGVNSIFTGAPSPEARLNVEFWGGKVKYTMLCRRTLVLHRNVEMSMF